MATTRSDLGVVIRRSTLEVLLGELAKHPPSDTATEDALAEARAAVAGCPVMLPGMSGPPPVVYAASGAVPSGPVLVATTHDERTCNWHRVSEREFRCEHGVVLDHHPNGWCDAGCCR